MRLSTSYYEGIRHLARDYLQECFARFPNCYRLLLPHIIRNMSKKINDNNEELEGTLFLIGDLYGTKQFSILTNSDWVSINQIITAFIELKHTKSETIIDLFDSLCYQIVKRSYTSSIAINISDNCIEYAKKVWIENQSLPKPAFKCPSDEEISNALKKANERNQININSYYQLIEKIVVLIGDEKL